MNKSLKSFLKNYTDLLLSKLLGKNEHLYQSNIIIKKVNIPFDFTKLI